MTEKKIAFDTRSDVEALVERFGGLRPCAARLGLAVGTVQGWKKRGSVPPTHQQKIRELLFNPREEQATGKEVKEGAGFEQFAHESEAETSLQKKEKEKETNQAEREKVKAEQKTQKEEETRKEETDKEEKLEEGIVSAFTGSDDFAGYSDESLDISSEMWEHAALPRSTSGQWAILISLIALAGVLTRPLWAERIDEKLMGVLGDGGHAHTSEQSSDSHTNDRNAQEDSQADDDKADTTALGEGADEGKKVVLPRDLSRRLGNLERDLKELDARQTAPAAAEMRRLKSESDLLVATFENQSARLDSLYELLQRRAEDLSRLRGQVERLEQNRATERLARRLNALFQLENVAYAVAQRSVFSLKPLEDSLSLAERKKLEGALSLLRQTKNLSSPQHLLADYRRLLPDLLTWQARHRQEQGGAERGFATRLAERLRAQMFSVFSIRRRYGEKDNALFAIESMLADGRIEQAEKNFAQAAPANEEAREMLGDEVAVRLEAFRAALSLRNRTFAALQEIRSVLSSRETGDKSPRQPSS